MRLPFSAALLSLLACGVGVAASIITVQKRAGCTQPSVRVHWTDLTSDERSSYISATKCLKTKPSVTGLENSKSLFDDFSAAHIALDDDIHNVAAMLPWHSGFVYAREVHLRQCGFQGRLPGWNWTVAADKNDPFNDPVFNKHTGLGGNGNPNQNNAVTNGPFSRFKVNLVDTNYQIDYSPHLLQRQFNSDDGKPHHGAVGFSDLRNSSTISHLMGLQTYQDFRQYIERPHSSIHDMVGGDMTNIQSPNDALFFLHHVRIDYLWRVWQQANPQHRLMDYYGNRANADEYDGPFKAQLTDKLRYYNLIPDMRVSDVMNAQGFTLCYVVSIRRWKKGPRCFDELTPMSGSHSTSEVEEESSI